MNRASAFEWHKRFKEGTESVKDDERCGRSKEDNTPELIGQRVRVRIRFTMLGFKGVQEEISPEETSTLQIGSVTRQGANTGVLIIIDGIGSARRKCGRRRRRIG